MIIRDRSYPHPVLAPFKDDVNPNGFIFTLKVNPDADNYYIDIQFSYENSTLSELIARGAAVHCVHIECRHNFYRHIVTFRDRSQRITIPAYELVGRVEVAGFIKSLGSLDSYRIEGSHPDYGDNTFLIRPGDILAVATSQIFDAFIDYDPLRRIASILTIQRSETNEEGVMELDTTGDKIVATLSQKDYDRYADLKADPTLGPLLANQVVVPAILEAIHEIKDTSDDEFEFDLKKRWFRSIFKKLEDSGIDIRTDKASPVQATQTILKLPLRRSLEGLIQINPLEDKP